MFAYFTNLVSDGLRRIDDLWKRFECYRRLTHPTLILEILLRYGGSRHGDSATIAPSGNRVPM